MELKICICFFIALITYSAHGQCPSGWKSLAGKCVLFDDTRSTWPNAESSCISKGGSLLHVKDMNMKNAIAQELSTRPVGFWWTGLHKSTSVQCQPNWRWNDDPNMATNINWLKEPNNMNGVEHCVEILKNGLSNDDNCAARRGYICKLSNGASQCDHDWVQGGPNCYYISTRSDTTKTDWNTARSLCQQAKPGADLMWIDAPAEAAWLKDRITKLWKIRGAGGSRGWWIGANDLPNGDKGPYKWNDGQQSQDDPEMYLEWDQEPTNAEGSSTLCGVFDNGVYFDGDCNEKHRTICQGNGGTCPSGWDAGAGQCFYFESSKWSTWQEARQQCTQTSIGGKPADLVAINSPQILAFVTQKLQEKGLGWMWTGLNDRDQGDRCSPFLWTDGTKAGPGTVTWGSEPNSWGGLEHCGEILRNGVFNDATCEALKSFACKAPVPAKRKKRQTQCADGWQYGAGRCFNFVKESVKMSDAQTKCRSMGADLLNVPSSQVKAEVERLVQANPGTWWTGLKRDDNPLCVPNWRWLEEFASDPSFLTWETEPNNLKGVEHCGEIWKDGVFNDARCESQRGFICKYDMIPGQTACAPEFEANGASCYFFSTRNPTSRQTWAGAKVECGNRQSGADLVWITSQDEYTFLTERVKTLSLILAKKQSGWWTGLNNEPSDNAINWKWNEQIQLADTSFIVWDAEPNNFNGNMLCGSIRDNGAAYRARDCLSKRLFICHLPNTATCPSNYQFDSGSNACYYIETNTKMTWAEARLYCQQSSQGAADLLTIRDVATKTYIEQTLAVGATYKVYWTGLNDLDQKSRCHPWKWRDGSKANMNNVKWNKEPNNFDGNEHCANMLQNGVMNDGSCTGKNAYICRYDLASLFDVSGTNGKCLILTNWNSRETDPSKYSWWWESCTDKARALCEMPNPGVCPLGFTIHLDSSCYAISTEWKDHDTNAAWCKSQNPAADLATIDNDSEAFRLGPLLVSAGVTGFGEFSVKKWNGITACNQAGRGWRKRGNSCYKFSGRGGDDGKSYNDARAECQQAAAGGDLVTFRNADEAEWIRQMVGLLWKTTGGWRNYMVGLDDNSGSWQWVDGTPYKPDYIVWEEDPNDWDDISVCTWIFKNGAYHTSSCNSNWLTGYICQKTVGGTGGPTSSCPFGWRERDGYCYMFGPKDPASRLNWADSRTACQTQMTGADLLSIGNADESEWVRDQAGMIWLDDPRWPGWWTGLNDLPNGNMGPWRWTDGTEYTESLITWSQQPNLFGGAQCTSIGQNGLYRSSNCNSKRSAICIQMSGGPSAGGLKGSPNGGQTAGIVIGVIVLIVLLAVLALVVYKMRTGPRPAKATGGIANILYGKE